MLIQNEIYLPDDQMIKCNTTHTTLSFESRLCLGAGIKMPNYYNKRKAVLVRLHRTLLIIRN